MDNNEVTTLVKRSQKGDAAAMEELLRVSYTSVSYQCRKFLKTGADAEDMTQEILLLVYTKLDTLHEPAAFWGWLGRMTANRCKNALTRTHEDLPILEDEEGNSVLDVIENEDRQTVPEEAFDNAETARMIGGIVDALPDAQRQCVMLYYYDEMSVKEISDLLGASENTVKSRLNYARKSIKDNVLDYEKKQGIRLHSLAPIPLLLYFLRMAAAESTDAGQAAQAVSAVMEKGAAASAGTAPGTAASATQRAATHALQGISVKTAAAAAAGLLLIGGVTAGIVTVMHHDQEEVIETFTPVETEEPEELAAQAAAEPEEPLEEPEAETAEPLFPAELLSSLPYTGDAGQCVITTAQAEAFADVLDGCITKSREAGYYEPPFCRGALFDAGDGIPALFVVWGSDMEYGDDRGYMPNVSQIYCWDGKQAKAAYESHPMEEYRFDEDISNIAVTDGGLIVSRDLWEDGMSVESSELYEVSGGMVSEKPAHVYEEFVYVYSSDTPPGEEVYKPVITGKGVYGGGYDLGTLTEDKWQYYPEYGETGGSWSLDGGFAAAALDGKFLSPGEAESARNAYAWYGPDWLLGHGGKWNTDVSHCWTGSWMDAEELAALLRRGGDGGAVEAAPGSGGAVSVEGNIMRTTLDSRGYDIEIYYEIPVFEESTEGCRKINDTFRAAQETFVDSGDDGPDGIWGIVEPNPPTSGHYYYTVSAEIMGQTDSYASVKQTLDMYLGGMRGSETTYYNFRTDTGEKLLLTDMIDGTEDEIREMVADAVAEAEPYANESGALDQIRSRDAGEFPFYIKDGSVYVCLDSYDIFGMAYGPGISIEAPLSAPLKAEWQ